MTDTTPEPAPLFNPPAVIQCGVNFRIGDPSKTCREIKRIRDVFGGIPEVPFKTDVDSFGVLVERIKVQFNRIRFPGETYTWHPRAVFLKPYHNSKQGTFRLLDATNAHGRIEQAWRNESARLKRDDGIVVHLFVYLSLHANGTQAGGRGEEGRGRMIRGGRDLLLHPDRLLLNPDRLPELFELRENRVQEPPRTLPESLVMEVQLEGTQIKFPVRIQLDVLRDALGLPGSHSSQGPR